MFKYLNLNDSQPGRASTQSHDITEHHLRMFNYTVRWGIIKSHPIAQLLEHCAANLLLMGSNLAHTCVVGSSFGHYVPGVT